MEHWHITAEQQWHHDPGRYEGPCPVCAILNCDAVLLQLCDSCTEAAFLIAEDFGQVTLYA